MLERRNFLKILFFYPLLTALLISKKFDDNRKFKKKKSGNLYWILSHSDN